MDALSDVLRVVRLTGGVFVHAQFTAPWCVLDHMTPQKTAALPMKTPEHVVLYHYIVEGSLSSRVEGGPEQHFGAGDALMLPRNDQHILGSDLNREALPSSDLVTSSIGGGMVGIQHGGGGEACRLVCGYLATNSAQGNPLFAALPRLLPFYAKDTPGSDWIRSTFKFAADEIAAGRPGSDTLLAKVSELLFVEAIRRYVEMLPPEQTGWLAGLRDPVIARVLALMHERLGEDWTVDKLGREAGLSRSTLAERFTKLIGEPPMQYLTNWRLQVAGDYLRNSAHSTERIAELVGYESAAAFSKSFRRVYGQPPSEWRRKSTAS
jgi:AraC-like DNA-binding protein